jgi:hypothetical protein
MYTIYVSNDRDGGYGEGARRRGARGVVRATTNDVTDECVFDLVRANA